MKTLFKFLSLAVLMTAFSALTFAQEPDLATLFEKFKTEAKAPCGERDTALATGKTIVEKFGADELNKEVIAFVQKRMATIEKEDPDCKRNKRYDATYKAKDWANYFAVSKEIIAAKANTGVDLDVLLDNVSVGYNLATVDKNDTYNNDTLNNAKTALQQLEAGKASGTKNFGVFEAFKTKEAAQSWMNYIIGWEMYNKMNQKKEALSYLYKSSTIGTEKKNDPSIYTNIGGYYFDEAARIFEDYTAKRKANNGEDNDETKALLGLSRGTADRAADAFGRAYKIVAADPKQAQAKTAIAKTLSDLYKFRFNLADAKQADVDAYVNNLTSKTMPDPSTPVTPVVAEEKPATTTTSTTPTTTTTPTNTAATTTKSATTTTTKPTTTATTTKTTTNTTMTATTTKPATTVKKPVTKKKGTR